MQPTKFQNRARRPATKQAKPSPISSSICNKTTLFGAVALILCLAGAGSWAVLKGQAAVAHKPAASSMAAALPPMPVRRSASDAEIERWSGEVRQKPKDDRAWVSLGDAYMQKA